MDTLLPESAPTWSDWIGILLALAGGAFALFQYWKNSQQSRETARQLSAIRAADEMEKFQLNSDVQLAERLIDWDSCYIPYRDEVGTLHRVYFGAADFHLALRDHTQPRSPVRDDSGLKPGAAPDAVKDGQECLFTPQEHYVRDVFDRFLGRLERVDALIERNVISADDFSRYYAYWLDLIANGGNHLSQDKRDTLIDYINIYNFHGVVRLFGRFGKDIRRPVARAGVAKP